MSIFEGVKIIEERLSPLSGKIRVVKSLGLGTYLQVAGLTQSGGVVFDIWRETLKRVKKRKVEKCLILGLGGGSAASLVQKYWQKAKVTGVDVDEVVVSLGRKYLGLKGVETKIKDAFDFVKEAAEGKEAYDLILVDTYLGYNFPERLESKVFLKNLKSLLGDNGLVIFNRLYWDQYRTKARRFEKILEEVFPKVEAFYPEANIMFLCPL